MISSRRCAPAQSRRIWLDRRADALNNMFQFPRNTAPPLPPEARGRHPYFMLKAAMSWLLPRRNPAGTVYGILVVGTLLAAEGSQQIGFVSLIGGVVVALVLYWLAHAYAAMLGRRLATTDRWSMRQFLAELAHEWALIRGASGPLLALVIAAAAGADLDTAVLIALGTCAALLVTFEVLAGVGEGLSRLEIASEAAVGAVLGLGLFAVRLLLH